MINRDQILSMLLEVCPSFTDSLLRVKADNDHEDLVYVYVGEFAPHLIDLFKKNQTDEFNAVFDLIEKLHVERDQTTREIATIGFLEGIQNVSGNSGVDPAEFVRFLRPESMKYWHKLNDFWSGLKV